MPRSTYHGYKMAIIHGNMKRVKHLILNEGLSAGHVFDCSDSALHLAVRFRQNSMAKFLLELNVFTNHKNKDGETPLTLAASNGDCELVNYLLYRGCKPQSADKILVTPLHIAAREGFVKIVKSLSDYGANIDAPSKSLERPIHFALTGFSSSFTGEETFTKTIVVLISLGADLTSPDRLGRTPLWLSVNGGDHMSHITRILLSRMVHPSSPGPSNCSPIAQAVRKGFVEQCKVLIEFNSCLDEIVKYDGQTGLLLDRSVYEKNDDITRLLSAAGCRCVFPTTWTAIGGVYKLTILCRREIRKVIGQSIPAAVNKLLLPASVKNFLLMKDVL